MKPLLIGECNPYSSDPRFALYPLPERASGHRLCTLVLGLTRLEYLRRYDRVDLCAGARWNLNEARAKAREIENTPRTIILLGAKVCKAFCCAFEPFTIKRAGGIVAVLLPHPSGLCQLWRVPGAFVRARELLREVGAL